MRGHVCEKQNYTWPSGRQPVWMVWNSLVILGVIFMKVLDHVGCRQWLVGNRSLVMKYG